MPAVDPPGDPASGQDGAWAALRDRVSITLRPIASPVPIGFLGLAAASLTLGGLQLGWVPARQGRQVGLVLIAFAFLAQLIAAIFSLLARDATTGSAMMTLGLTWFVTGLVLASGRPGQTSRALGLFLLFSATAMVLTAATAAMSTLLSAVIFLTAGVRFLVTGVYHLTDSIGWQRAGGVLGLALFLLAMYAAWAAELEAARRRPVLPTGRRGAGRVAVAGSLYEQVQSVSTEPGVRRQL